MLVVAQLPMVDIRPFLEVATHRLERPDWGQQLSSDSVSNASGFVRNIGRLRQRRLAVDASWENEGIYCNAHRAVHLPSDLSRREFGSGSASISAFKGSSKVGSRRYYSYAPVTRIEIGLSRIWGPHDLAGSDLNEFIESMLRLPLSVRNSTDSEELYAAGKSLAALILDSTTRQRPQSFFQPASWWVTPGLPMLFIEYHESEIKDPPGTGSSVELPTCYNLRLFHWVSHNHHGVQAWLLGRSGKSDRDALRQIRLHLMRLHAELECAKGVLRLVRLAQGSDASRRIVPTAGTSQEKNLRNYVERLQRLLNREEAYGHAQENILQAAFTATRQISPDWGAVQQACQRVLDDLTQQNLERWLSSLFE